MNIEKMLLNNSRKAMLDNIQALDKKTLQKELKEHLQKEFQFYDELQRKDNNWNELKKFLIDLQKLKGINQQGFSWGVCQEVLDKIKELEEKVGIEK